MDSSLMTRATNEWYPAWLCGDVWADSCHTGLMSHTHEMVRAAYTGWAGLLASLFQAFLHARHLTHCTHMFKGTIETESEQKGLQMLMTVKLWFTNQMFKLPLSGNDLPGWILSHMLQLEWKLKHLHLSFECECSHAAVVQLTPSSDNKYHTCPSGSVFISWYCFGIIKPRWASSEQNMLHSTGK